jgi:hypothetical protein
MLDGIPVDFGLCYGYRASSGETGTFLFQSYVANASKPAAHSPGAAVQTHAEIRLVLHFAVYIKYRNGQKNVAKNAHRVADGFFE